MKICFVLIVINQRQGWCVFAFHAAIIKITSQLRSTNKQGGKIRAALSYHKKFIGATVVK